MSVLFLKISNSFPITIKIKSRWTSASTHDKNCICPIMKGHMFIQVYMWYLGERNYTGLTHPQVGQKIKIRKVYTLIKINFVTIYFPKNSAYLSNLPPFPLFTALLPYLDPPTWQVHSLLRACTYPVPVWNTTAHHICIYWFVLSFHISIQM